MKPSPSSSNNLKECKINSRLEIKGENLRLKGYKKMDLEIPRISDFQNLFLLFDFVLPEII